MPALLCVMHALISLFLPPPLPPLCRPLPCNRGKILGDINAEFAASAGGDKAANELLAQLKETDNLAEVSADELRRREPALFRLRAPKTLASFVERFYSVDANKSAYPILDSFLQLFTHLGSIVPWEDVQGAGPAPQRSAAGKFGIIQHLPALLAFVESISARFNRRLRKGDAEGKTVGKVLTELPLHQRNVFTTLFDDFKSAWNSVRPFIDFCEDPLHPFQMSKGASLSSCLPDTEGMGRQIVDILTQTAAVQNNFLAEVDKFLVKVLATEGSDSELVLYAPMNRGECMPLNALNKERLIHLDAERDVMDAVDRCTTQPLGYGKGTRVHLQCDFSAIQRHIIVKIGGPSKAIIGNTAENMIVRMFEFAGSNMRQLMKRMCKNISQTELSKDLEADILRAINTRDKAAALKHSIEVCVGFLNLNNMQDNNHQPVSPRTAIADYAATLGVNVPKEFANMQAMGLVPKIEHLHAVWVLLENNFGFEFEDVDPDYKKDLSAAHADAVDHLVVVWGQAGLDLQTAVDLLKRFILEYPQLTQNPKVSGSMPLGSYFPFWLSEHQLCKEEAASAIEVSLSTIDLPLGSVVKFYFKLRELLEK